MITFLEFGHSLYAHFDQNLQFDWFFFFSNDSVRLLNIDCSITGLRYASLPDEIHGVARLH